MVVAACLAVERAPFRKPAVAEARHTCAGARRYRRSRRAPWNKIADLPPMVVVACSAAELAPFRRPAVAEARNTRAGASTTHSVRTKGKIAGRLSESTFVA